MSDLEEYKELGEEYRYRDQLMVQEFSLSMVAVGVVFNQVWDATASPELLGANTLVFCFLCVLVVHLGRLNQDRVAALDRRAKLGRTLSFDSAHGAVTGRRFRLVPLPAPVLMIWFVRILAGAWGYAAVVVAWKAFPQIQQVLNG